jgi:hypothetical protein
MEKIYTIPVNETFEVSDGCPFCRLFKRLEDNELDIILGASMMEPDIRIETNKKGFCLDHYNKMFEAKNRLGLALMLESHLDELIAKLSKTPLIADKVKTTSDYLEDASHSCYICDRIENNFQKMVECACILWETDEAFREKFSKTPFFCIEHYSLMMKCASLYVSKKVRPDFYKAASAIELEYLKTLKEDVSWFCKKFDYRYDSEPWGNSKDAVERAIKSVYHK